MEQCVMNDKESYLELTRTEYRVYGLNPSGAELWNMTFAEYSSFDIVNGADHTEYDRARSRFSRTRRPLAPSPELAVACLLA